MKEQPCGGNLASVGVGGRVGVMLGRQKGHVGVIRCALYNRLTFSPAASRGVDGSTVLKSKKAQCCCDLHAEELTS